MEPIRVVAGTGAGPTRMAAYDAALADANLHNYNLVSVSSVIPSGATVRTTERALELGSVGDRLTVVEASAVGRRTAVATLAWGRRANGEDPGAGLFYEASGADGPTTQEVRETARTGLSAGADLREWELVEREDLTAEAGGEGAHVGSVVVAVYGSGESLL